MPEKEVLIGMIADLYVAEIPMARVYGPKQDSIGQIIRSKIAAKYGMTSEEFSEVVKRLQTDPELNAEIHDSVAVVLEEKRKEGLKRR